MKSKEIITSKFPDGFGEQTGEWHFDRFIEFTKCKMGVGEPSPHLTVLGFMMRDCGIKEKLWRLGCYAATYCLPTAQIVWKFWSYDKVSKNPDRFYSWVESNWKGIIIRHVERRCVNTFQKMNRCFESYLKWMNNGEYEKLLDLGLKITDPKVYYDRVWSSFDYNKDKDTGVFSFGRYIRIRLVEGLKRYCDIPANLYDIRAISMDAWSPKQGLCLLYPQYVKSLLTNDDWGNQLTDFLANDLFDTVQKTIPNVTKYIIAAMLCEYKGAFCKRHQYVGWTIDQEIGLYDKVISYWKNQINKEDLFEARKHLFPLECLGEVQGWNDTRMDCASVLRDFGYIWTDKLYDYNSTVTRFSDLAKPVCRGSS